MDGAPWLGEGRASWLDDVERWVGAAGELIELQPVEERVWGAVLRAITPSGPRYFKAAGPLCRHEPTIVSDLAPRWPDLVPEVLAVDPERAWLLLADHGMPMRESASVPDQVDVLERLLPAYAAMQASTVAEVPRWRASGTPDRRVERLPELLEELLTDGSPAGALLIDGAARAAHLADLPLLTTVCEELATSPVPDALDHADLHGTNVLVDESGHHRLIDWGDSCITHPFSSLFVPIELVVRQLPASDQKTATLRLRDAYLEPWAATGSADEHRRTLGLAVWVAGVTRAIAVAHESPGTPDDHAEVVDLLRGWHAKRTLLDHPDELIQPR